MKIVVIDGQGGGIGRNLVEQIRERLPGAEIIAAGANSIATSNMLRAGADVGATGENAVVFNCRNADIIAGPIGILSADAMYGEITPAMADAVSRSGARKVLIPVAKCSIYVVGVAEQPLARYLRDAADYIASLPEAYHT